METNNPILALVIFTIICVLLFFLFRPKKGFFWIVKNNLRQNDKTVIEDILKQLYHVENKGKEEGLNSLLGALKIDDKILIDAIGKMESKGLITTSGGVIKLNQSGRDYALKIIRVHRLWEKYLSEKTGIDKSEWHDRAELKEHELNAEQVNILATQLGNPRFDPHGDPIPTKDGEIQSVKGESLASLSVDTVGRITHIEDEPEVIYKQIIAEDIHIGSQLRVVESDSKRVRFYSEGTEYVLAPIVAENITVRVFEKEEIPENHSIRLSSLRDGENAKIVGISRECRGASRRRLLDLGFVMGSDIHIDLASPMNNPKAYLVKGTSIAIRNEQAEHILIRKERNDGE